MEQIKILYVEDDPGDAKLVRRALLSTTETGDVRYKRAFSVDIAESGEKCIEKIRKEKYDVLLVDYNLPKMSGLDVLTKIIEDGYDAPVIMVTGSGDEETAVNAMKRGAWDYIVKAGDYLRPLPLTIQNVVLQYEMAKEKRRVEEALRESEEKNRNLIEYANDAIFTLNLNGAFQLVNKKFEEITGFKREEVMGKKIAEIKLIDPEYSELVDQDLKKKIKGYSGEPYEIAIINRKGERKYIELSTTAVIEKGNIVGIQGIGRDITERKKLEQELVQTDKLASLGQLVAGIAHEINNPIAYIKSNNHSLASYLDDIASLLTEYRKLKNLEDNSQFESVIKRIEDKEAEIDPDFVLDDLNKLLEESQEGIERIATIVKELRSFARPEEVPFEYADINEELDKTLRIAQHEFRDRIKVNKEYGRIPRIQCHASQLSQVFLNILLNAGQAIEDEGTVTVKTFEEDNKIVIEISDDGRGMDKETMKHIFNPFFTTRGVSGTGLGLSVSYGIIKKHNGEIHVKSEVGKGTTFRIELPQSSKSHET
ncbi:hybrid sensor histidine kinase/response regulator [Methanophagales archaeon]|nr:MAG: hybrid sensor histidine kinase/response regulator [Methanophagales archaeon]